jgi:acylphosphatase
MRAFSVFVSLNANSFVTMENIVCKRIWVSGRVQGVFYRDSTCRLAQQLNLVGGVRNLYDGRVEVQVCGDVESVESLVKWLKIGPKLAKVTTIEVEDLHFDSDDGQFTDRFRDTFTVWPTR